MGHCNNQFINALCNFFYMFYLHVYNIKNSGIIVTGIIVMMWFKFLYCYMVNLNFVFNAQKRNALHVYKKMPINLSMYCLNYL